MSYMAKIKDPIYGTIEIDSDILHTIVDTAEFQRLRRILHPSYSPVYPTALHNRFVHSLGVYYLGTMASRAIVLDGRVQKAKAKNIKKVFELACLLHDVGHAPFSHTSENFFLDQDKEKKEQYRTIIYELCDAIDITKSIDRNEYMNDLIGNMYDPKPHEILSSIIGIRCFGDMIGNKDDKEFFARCIIGYKYSDSTDGINSTERDIRNGFISLLNGSVIDVDKLDYLIRDSYVLGLESVTLDYETLLGALTFIKVGDHYELGYYKSAMSVLDHIVYASDIEKKWLQRDAVTNYDTHLIKSLIKKICQELDTDQTRIFSSASLTKEGVCLNNGEVVRFLSDDDLIYLIKKYLLVSNAAETDAEEYFNRQIRPYPLWRTEIEYKALIKKMKYSDKNVSEFEAKMKDVINDLNTKGYDISLYESGSNTRKVLEALAAYKEQYSLSGSFQFLSGEFFDSGYNKNSYKNLNIVFKDENDRFSEKAGVLLPSLIMLQEQENLKSNKADGNNTAANTINRKNFFFMYYKEATYKQVPDKVALLTKLIKSI